MFFPRVKGVLQLYYNNVIVQELSEFILPPLNENIIMLFKMHRSII